MPKIYPDLVLAIAPIARGFAFILLEGPLTPFDWGIVRIRKPGINARCLERAWKIVEDHHPASLILPDCNGHGASRSLRVKAFVLALRHLAHAKEIEVREYNRASVRGCFSLAGARTRYEIAQAIARQIPALSHYLPPARKTWASEGHGQALFDAAALGMTDYCRTARGDQFNRQDQG